jgi:GTP diphosphokinase / guanosine-3',5'-bis(diphosphate) 3'-diphosphatase
MYNEIFNKLLKVKNDLNNAFIIAFFIHKDQKDKVGDPYILHPIKIFTSVITKEQQIIALLHDVLEDSDIKLNQLQYYFSDDIIEALEAISKRKNESYKDYLKRVKENNLAKIVKYYDINHNLDPQRLYKLEESVRKRLIKKYEYALYYLLS